MAEKVLGYFVFLFSCLAWICLLCAARGNADATCRKYRLGISCVQCHHVSIATCRRLFGGKGDQRQRVQEPEQQCKDPAESALSDSALLIAVSLQYGTLSLGILAPTGSLPFLQQRPQRKHQPQQEHQLQQQQEQGQDYFDGAAGTISVFGHGSRRWSFTLLWLRKARRRDQLHVVVRMEIRLASATLLYNGQADACFFLP